MRSTIARRPMSPSPRNAPNPFDVVTDHFVKEDIERRRSPRAPLEGVTVRLADRSGALRSLDATEGSPASLFLSFAEPDRFETDRVLVGQIARGPASVACPVRVHRLESSPRRGIVVLLEPHADAAPVIPQILGV